MVHVEGPGGDEMFPRERGDLNDHEQRALDGFRCPTCGSPLDLFERQREAAPGTTPGDDECCELMAACRQCMLTFTKEDWQARGSLPS
ncbi:MAG TPA: hypothetical protein VFQ54_01855 [Thermomicrobiales bacterium]|nr:hypothetical protein [Thermomicrobiales bacterium]